MHDQPPAEEWRPIPGYEGYYEASSLGRIRSVPRTVRSSYGSTQRRPSRILRPKIDRTGYFQVNLSVDGVVGMRSVHTLVAETFVSGKAPELEVGHKDHTPLNNVPSNLHWITHEQNAQDSRDAGRFSAGQNPRRAKKLTPDKITAIKEYRRSTRLSLKEIGKRFDISASMVGLIVRDLAWTVPTP